MTVCRRALTVLLLMALVFAFPATVVGAGPTEFGPTKADLLRSSFQSLSHPGDQVVPGALIVTLTDAVAAEALGHAAEIGALGPVGDVVRVTARIRVLEVPLGSEVAVAAAVAEQPGVRAVEVERLRRRAAQPNDARYGEQWAHQQTNIEAAWDIQTGSADVTVAVLDEGILGTHPDLRDTIVEQVSTASGVVQDRGVNVDNDPCRGGHGTLVAGVIGASGDNGTDVAGVNWQVSILDINLNNPSVGCDFFSDRSILAGIDYARQAGADVINMSLGGPSNTCPSSFQSVINDARGAGVVVVAAAGNSQQEFPNQPQVPASCSGVISVGATGRSGQVAVYSTNNQFLDLAAPGGDGLSDGQRGLVLTTSRGPFESALAVQGTSFASPYVAGVAALLLAEDPTLTPDEVEGLLEATAQDIGPAGFDNATGHGLVRPDHALQMLTSGEAPPPPEPAPEMSEEEMDDFDMPAPEPPRPPNVWRVQTGQAVTQAIPQAVAVSQELWGPGEAFHVVLARDDDYPDALAGSALGFGFGPLLFTTSTSSGDALAPETRAEIQRVLPQGQTVYLLGGSAALPSGLEAELEAMGYNAVRLQGQTREGTAARVAVEVDRFVDLFVAQSGFQTLDGVILATRGNWPDAVAAGSLASYFGLPVLLTEPNALHSDTAAMLQQLSPEYLVAVGGTAVLSDAVVEQARQVAGVPPERTFRLHGAARDATAVAVAGFMEQLFAEFEGRPPSFAVAVNLRREPDGYAHVLSATAITGATGAVFVPVEGDGGTTLTQVVRDYVTGFGIDGVVTGGQDLISAEVEAELSRLLAGG